MDSATLVNEQRVAGAKLLRLLDRALFPVQAALWLYETETGIWRLILATPWVRQFGPLEAYRQVQQTLMGLPEAPLLLSRVQLLADDDPFVQSLATTLPLSGSEQLEVRGETAGAFELPHAFIYRLLTRAGVWNNGALVPVDPPVSTRSRAFVDAYRREPHFLLGAALVDMEREQSLRSAWDELRAEIRDTLLAEPSTRSRFLRERGDGLPDVWASALYQSQGYYRPLRPETPDYWRRNRDWLRQALDLAVAHDVKFLCLWTLLDARAMPADLIDTVRPFTLSEAAARRLARTLGNPYLQLIPPLLHRLEWIAIQQERSVAVVWDDDHDSRGFENLGLYQALHGQGHFTRMSPPTFTNTRHEPLLGLADVLCYVAGRYLHGVRMRQVPPDIGDWWRTYVFPSLLSSGAPADQRAEWALTVELALAQYGHTEVNPSALRELRNRLAHDVDVAQVQEWFPESG
ncbi:DUF3800 domain-containing protein [Deinococcus yunweiensis]|uniref:DUF3800 domain-containing protein n=1 Tax=Deinococcus yunweiensis TaxID=367282 RepID=UPI00398EF6F8